MYVVCVNIMMDNIIQNYLRNVFVYINIKYYVYIMCFSYSLAPCKKRKIRSCKSIVPVGNVFLNIYILLGSI